MDRPTFSQSWSRVNRLTPTLRPQVQLRRRSFRGQPWYVAHDPITNQFFRLNPVAYHLVGLLDGRRSVDAVWKMTLERFGDEAPTQHEVIGLLSQMNQANLLRIDLPPDAEPLLQRQRRRNTGRLAQGAMSLMFLQVPLFNPDVILQKLGPYFRPVLSRLGLVLWTLWLGVGLWYFLPHAGQFVRDTGSILAPANWGWMIFLFIIIKAWHELGHGLMCRRFGGAVPECGIMMLVLFPSPYMDTTSAWNFESKWQRVLVGAAGMMFELTVAAGAAIVWVHSEPETLTRQLAHNVVLLASIATVLFNANPLMRFDGYFILSDTLEIPNLYERSTRQLYYLAQRYLLRLDGVQAVSSDAGESATLLVYGLGAAVYRVLVMFGIVLYISGWAFTLGLFLAAWTLITWLVVPAGKLVHWLTVSPSLHRKRLQTVGVVGGALAAVVILVGLTPMPEHRRTQGVVEAAGRQDLSVQADGFVTAVHAQAGDLVAQGQVLLEADNPNLTSRRKELEGQLAELRIARRESLLTKPAEQIIADARIDAVQKELAQVHQRLDDLTLRAPCGGRLVAPAMNVLVGQYLKRGKTLGQIIDPASLRVTALMDQGQNSLAVFDEVEKVELRSAGRKDQVIPSRLLRAFDAGSLQLPHPALGHAGGGLIPTDPQDGKGLTALRPQFTVWLALPEHDALALPGERYYVRFTLLQRQPLLWQWAHLLRQLFRDRVAL